MDPRQALADLDAILARCGRGIGLDPPACQRLLELIAWAPGRVRLVAEALAGQRTSAAVDALRQLPATVPGVVEGLHQAFFHGVARRTGDHVAPRMLALDFLHSRAGGFPALLERCARVFGPGFERLRIGEQTGYRFRIAEGRGTLAGRASAQAQDTEWLHRRLSRLASARLWLNGWDFPARGAFPGAIQIHLVRAWLSWAARQIETRT